MYFIELQKINQDIINLNEDYNNLQLEKLHLLDKDVIKKYVLKKGMHIPDENDVKIFKLE